MRNKPLTAIILFYSLNSYSSTLNIEECNTSEIKYDEPLYAETEEERVIRMDQKLEELLNNFEECVEAAESSFSENNSQSSNSKSSSASNSASGNEIILNKQEEKSEISSIDGDTKDSNLPDDIVQGDNGSTPQDIPDISTDDTTAKQLRAVAEGEEDPYLKEIYWDAYWEYKGIKSKN